MFSLLRPARILISTAAQADGAPPARPARPAGNYGGNAGGRGGGGYQGGRGGGGRFSPSGGRGGGRFSPSGGRGGGGGYVTTSPGGGGPTTSGGYQGRGGGGVGYQGGRGAGGGYQGGRGTGGGYQGGRNSFQDQNSGYQGRGRGGGGRGRGRARGENTGSPYVMNGEIKADQVRVIDDEKTPIGVMELDQALDMARDQEVDLVLINADAEPPLCRLIEWSKLKFEKEKADKMAKRKQRENAQDLKELKMRPTTGVHDYEVRVKQAKQFISKNDKVKVIVQVRKGRKGTEKQERRWGYGERGAKGRSIHGRVVAMLPFLYLLSRVDDGVVIIAIIIIIIIMTSHHYDQSSAWRPVTIRHKCYMAFLVSETVDSGSLWMWMTLI